MCAATSWIHQIDQPNASLCLALGRIEVEALTTLLEQHPRGVFWVVDPEYIDLSCDLPSNLAVFLLEESPGQELEDCLSTFIHLDPVAFPSIRISNDTMREHSALYENILSRIQTILATNRNARNTRSRFAFQKQQRFLQNLPYYLSHRLPENFKNQTAGIPAIIIGAGPSLEVSLPKLVPLAHKAITFVADSAVKAVAHSGIRSDITISIDNVKTPKLTLPEQFQPNILVTTPESPPQWHALNAPLPIMISGRSMSFDWLATNNVPKTPVVTESNVGATAIRLAAFMGCNPIILVGLDYASDHENENSTHHKLAYKPEESDRKGIGIPGNYRETVPSIYHSEWGEVNTILSEVAQNHTIYNVNDRGAKLSGSHLINPVENFHSIVQNHLKEEWNKDEITSRLKTQLEQTSVTHHSAGQGLDQKIADHTRWAGNQLKSIKDLSDTSREFIINTLRQLFLNQDFSGLFGYYAMKAMPQLIRIDCTSDRDLQELIQELKVLCQSGLMSE